MNNLSPDMAMLDVAGSWASIFGVIISLVGFFLAVRNSRKSREAAEQAQMAASETRKAIASYDSIHEFGQALAILEEIKRHHMNKSWHSALERYPIARDKLILVRRICPELSDDGRGAISRTLGQLNELEESVTKAIEKDADFPRVSRANRVLAREKDCLTEVLADVKTKLGVR